MAITKKNNKALDDIIKIISYVLERNNWQSLDANTETTPCQINYIYMRYVLFE